MRRSVESLVVAATMDLRLRQILVEGDTDRDFIRWFLRTTDKRLLECVQVWEVASLHIPNSSTGGNRQRLITAHGWLTKEAVADRFRTVIDRDSPLEDDIQLPGLHLTDGRDLESAVLGVDNYDATVCMALGIDALSAEELKSKVDETALLVAAVREVSIQRGWRLPVSKGAWVKHVRVRGGEISFDLRKACTGLLQAASVSLEVLEELLTATSEIVETLRRMPLERVVHGKDAIRIVGRYSNANGGPSDVQAMFLSSATGLISAPTPLLQNLIEFATPAIRS